MYPISSEKDIDEVLQIRQIFLNVSKGQVAPHEDLLKAFNTTDINKIVLEILESGEIQLSEKERKLKLNQINNEVLQIISTKCVNPKTKKRYPPTMIQKALNELKANISNKPPKSQALELIKLLIQHQIIPIARARMKVKLDATLLNDKLTELLDIQTRAGEVTALIDPVHYRELVELTNGKLEVLDMAVIDD